MFSPGRRRDRVVPAALQGIALEEPLLTTTELGLGEESEAIYAEDNGAARPSLASDEQFSELLKSPDTVPWPPWLFREVGVRHGLLATLAIASAATAGCLRGTLPVGIGVGVWQASCFREGALSSTAFTYNMRTVGLAFIAAGALAFLLQCIEVRLFGLVGRRLGRRMRGMVMQRILARTIKASAHEPVRTTAVVEGLLLAYEKAISTHVSRVARASCAVGTILPAILYFVPLGGVFGVAVVMVVILVDSIGAAVLRRLARRAEASARDALGIVRSALWGIETVTSYGLQPMFMVGDITVRAAFIRAARAGGGLAAVPVASCLMYWWAIGGLSKNMDVMEMLAGPGECAMVVFGLFAMMESASMLLDSAPQLWKGARAASSLWRFVDTGRTQEDLQPAERRGSTPEQDVDLGDVRYTYHHHNGEISGNVLNGLTVQARRGHPAALFGSEGSGKSTVLRLVREFSTYGDAVEGRVVAGRIRVPVGAALCSCDGAILPVSIAENIAIGMVGCDAEDWVNDSMRAKAGGPSEWLEPLVSRAIDCARECGIHDFISSLPDGYRTVVASWPEEPRDCSWEARGPGRDSVVLTVAQRCGVLLARALMSTPSTVLVDDVPSELVTETVTLAPQTDAGARVESFVSVLERLGASRAVIIATRHAHVARWASSIHVVEGGYVVEAGSHEDLWAHGSPGRYHAALSGEMDDVNVLMSLSIGVATSPENSPVRDGRGVSPGLQDFIPSRSTVASPMVNIPFASSISQPASAPHRRSLRRAVRNAGHADGPNMFGSCSLWTPAFAGQLAAVLSGFLVPCMAVVVARNICDFITVKYDDDHLLAETRAALLGVVGVLAGVFEAARVLSTGAANGTYTRNIRLACMRSVLFRPLVIPTSADDDDEGDVGLTMPDLLPLGNRTARLNAISSIISVLDRDAAAAVGVSPQALTPVIASVAALVTAAAWGLYYSPYMAVVLAMPCVLLITAVQLEEGIFATVLEEGRGCSLHTSQPWYNGAAVMEAVMRAGGRIGHGMVDRSLVLALYQSRAYYAQTLERHRTNLHAAAGSLVAGLVYFLYGVAFWYGAALASQDPDETRNTIAAALVMIITAQVIGRYLASTPSTPCAGTIAQRRAVGLVQPAALRLASAACAAATDTDIQRRPSRGLSGAIDFQNVTLDDGSLRSFSAAMEACETVVLLGGAASGLHAVPWAASRLSQGCESHGRVLLDGMPASDAPVNGIRSSVSVVTRDTAHLFEGWTIADNIRAGLALLPGNGSSLGRITSSDMRLIVGAAKEAHAHAFIVLLPNGYDTVVTPGCLEPWQAWRVGLARGLVRSPAILVVSADDCESDNGAGSGRDVLAHVCQGRTAIVLSSRRQVADSLGVGQRVVVIENGRAVESY